MKNQFLTSDCSLPFYFIVRNIMERANCSSRPGYIGSISSEAVLFSSNPSLSFPIRDVEGIEYKDADSDELPAINMVVNFSGLTGSSSPLPEFYSESLLHAGEETSSSKKLLDMFDHRLLSFIYRSWEARRYIDVYNNDGNDSYTNNLFSLFGMRGNKNAKDGDIDWVRLLPFALYFRNKITSASALERIIAYYFSLSSVMILPFRRQETRVLISDRSNLGINNSVLANDLVIGTSVAQYDARFIVCLGPLSYRIFRSFLPGSVNLTVLRKLVTQIVARPLTMQVNLLIEPSDIPRLVLANANIFQLGYNCWLGKPKQGKFCLTL